MSKKNSKKNRLKSKDRFRNSIIANESSINISDNVQNTVSVDNNPIVATPLSSTKLQSLGSELKLIGIIGSVLVTILVITSLII